MRRIFYYMIALLTTSLSLTMSTDFFPDDTELEIINVIKNDGFNFIQPSPVFTKQKEHDELMVTAPRHPLNNEQEHNNDDDDKLLVPITTQYPAQALVIKNINLLFTKYRYAEENDWEYISQRRFSVSCPVCKKQLTHSDLSGLINNVNIHCTDSQHAGVDREDLVENYCKNLTYDILTRCAMPGCTYLCNTKYYTLIGAFKSLHAHFKQKHTEETISHEGIKNNLADPNQEKKYLLIKKTTEIVLLPALPANTPEDEYQEKSLPKLIKKKPGIRKSITKKKK